MKATAELKMLPVSVLKPAAYNPRKKLKPGDKEYEKIKNSITEFGFADPLVVNADMTIIGGHQRLTVAMELGYTEVPCAVVDIDKTREKALNIALNKITGAWDDSLLADLLKDIEDSNFDLGKTGFEPPEIETLFNKVHSKEVKEDDFDVESELKQPCFSKEGDLWHLGKHIVLCGDSTKAECYDTLMDGTKANLVLSDPPYNVDVEETAGKIMNDNMGDSEFYQFLLAAFQQMHGHLADDGSIYIFHADTEGLNFRNIYTLDSNGRMILTILASVAEEESHSKSIIMNWYIDRRFSRGLFLTPALLGYDQDEDGNLVVNQDEAQTVKVIYYLYLNGFSLKDIAELLTDCERKTKLGNTEWNPGTIAGIIANERHCGDVLSAWPSCEWFIKMPNGISTGLTA